jgi:MYXO-CTERM domain-containing protein
MTCTQINEGPVTCGALCSLGDAGSCPSGQVCSGQTLYAMGNEGQCVNGCASDADCTGTPGTVCGLCAQSCVIPGSATGKIGDPCTDDSVCPTGSTCQNNMFLPGGYCTLPCQPGDTGVCSCPAGSGCTQLAKNFMPTNLCLESCTSNADCTRAGYVCQPGDTSGPVCLPPCQIFMGIDICTFIYDTTKACDTVSGVCGGLVMPDAGMPDAGQPDAGQPDSGMPADSGMNMDDAGMGVVMLPAVPTDIGKNQGGCGCTETGPLPFGLLALLALGARRRKS